MAHTILVLAASLGESFAMKLAEDIAASRPAEDNVHVVVDDLDVFRDGYASELKIAHDIAAEMHCLGQRHGGELRKIASGEMPPGAVLSSGYPQPSMLMQPPPPRSGSLTGAAGLGVGAVGLGALAMHPDAQAALSRATAHGPDSTLMNGVIRQFNGGGSVGPSGPLSDAGTKPLHSFKPDVDELEKYRQLLGFQMQQAADRAGDAGSNALEHMSNFGHSMVDHAGDAIGGLRSLFGAE